jgi:hypothetical protein
LSDIGKEAIMAPGDSRIPWTEKAMARIGFMILGPSSLVLLGSLLLSDLARGKLAQALLDAALTALLIFVWRRVYRQHRDAFWKLLHGLGYKLWVYAGCCIIGTFLAAALAIAGLRALSLLPAVVFLMTCAVFVILCYAAGEYVNKGAEERGIIGD